ncbi:Cytochrome bo(3) ubiquinol oxidase subunit 3 [Candidatus Hepatincola sp. Av]
MDKNIDKLHEHHEMHARDISLYGFWIYIMTDCILFGTLFLIFIVLTSGMHPYNFSLPYVMTETLALLTSSFTFGMAVLNMHKKMLNQVFIWIGITFILGATFIFLEVREFIHLVSEGYTWTTHAYFSAFFTLVGTHGIHVTIGLIWMLALIIQIAMRGITAHNTTKLMVLSLFWHFLDIVWIFVFSIVYLVGAL